MNYKESKKILEKIKKSKKILINCHRRPDADSVSSALAMQNALRILNIDSEIISPDQIPEGLKFLEGTEMIKTVDFRHFNFKAYDLFLILDSPSWDFITGDKASKVNKGIYKILIDHHIRRDKFTEFSLVEENVSSTSEILYLLFADWKLKLDQMTASALLSGIIGDTLCFKIPATTARTLTIASELIKLGANRQYIADNLFSRLKFDLVKFMGEVLQRLEYDESGKFVWSAIPLDVFKKYNYPSGAKNMTANMFFGSIKEGDFGMLMVEEKKDNLLISFRSADRFDVAKIASALGGGGHRDSSATLIIGKPFDESVKLALETARKYAKKNQEISN